MKLLTGITLFSAASSLPLAGRRSRRSSRYYPDSVDENGKAQKWTKVVANDFYVPYDANTYYDADGGSPLSEEEYVESGTLLHHGETGFRVDMRIVTEEEFYVIMNYCKFSGNCRNEPEFDRLRTVTYGFTYG